LFPLIVKVPSDSHLLGTFRAFTNVVSVARCMAWPPTEHRAGGLDEILVTAEVTYRVTEKVVDLHHNLSLIFKSQAFEVRQDPRARRGARACQDPWGYRESQAQWVLRVTEGEEVEKDLQVILWVEV
jgi:hypothetical protein